jgi:hypothetical protein
LQKYILHGGKEIIPVATMLASSLVVLIFDLGTLPDFLGMQTLVLEAFWAILLNTKMCFNQLIVIIVSLCLQLASVNPSPLPLCLSTRRGGYSSPRGLPNSRRTKLNMTQPINAH